MIQVHISLVGADKMRISWLTKDETPVGECMETVNVLNENLFCYVASCKSLKMLSGRLKMLVPTARRRGLMNFGIFSERRKRRGGDNLDMGDGKEGERGERGEIKLIFFFKFKSIR